MATEGRGGPAERRRPPPRATALRSLVAKRILLLLVFCAVPVILYDQFRVADAESRRLLLDALREQGRLMAENLQPLLTRSEPSPLIDLPAAVARLATPETGLKVLFRPAEAVGAEGFFFVASEPPVPPATLAAERDRLIERGVLGRLAATCAGGAPIALRHRDSESGEELLTSINPVTTEAGCWAVVTAHAGGAFLGTSIGQPYWRNLEVRVAAVIYLLLALLTMGLFFGVWRDLMRFRATARRIRGGGWPAGGFAAENRVPELTVVAEEFDRMTRALRESAEDIRRAAEDNAHAFKTPIAILRQAVEPLRRLVPGESERGRRAVEMIEESIDRLDHLVTCARRLDETTAELLDPPRQAIDLSDLVERMLAAYAEAFAGRGLRFRSEIAPRLVVRAGEELLETVIENVVDNAIGVSRPGSEIAVSLAAEHGRARLTVADHGPGVPDDQLARIFERYVSLRGIGGPAGAGAAGAGPTARDQGAPGMPTPAAHFGIGLWIVRRNLEAVGGAVVARNRPEGGLAVSMELPLAA